MVNKPLKDAKFAVVFFEGDETFSEVPTNWLTNDNQYCWWPSKTRNLTSLIIKRAPPAKDWDKFAIRVESFCSTIESARKKAVDSNYTSAEDEDNNIGRGKRKKKSTRFDEQSESDDESGCLDEYVPPPKLIRKERESLAVISNYEVSDRDGDLNDTLVPQKDVPFTPPLSPCDEIPVNTPTSSNLSSCSFQDTTAFQNILGKIGKTCSFIKLSLENIEKRLTELETNKVPQNIEKANYEELFSFIPIKDSGELDTLENYLLDVTKRKLLCNYMHSVGGRDAKDATHRVLSKLFTNKMGIGCSWLGQRNNIKIRDLKCIASIKGVIMSQYTDFKEANYGLDRQNYVIVEN